MTQGFRYPIAHSPARLAALALTGCAISVTAPVLAQAPVSTTQEPATRAGPAGMASLRPAIYDDTLAIDGEDIAAQRLGTRMTVEVRVNGTGPYRFIVDSGADTSVVGQQIANALRLPMASSVVLNGITNSAIVPRVAVDELALGTQSIRDLKVPVLREVNIGAQGMIGLDALVEQQLVLDFDERKVTIADARKPLPRYVDEIVVTARRRRGQLILTQATANGSPVDAVIDTGSQVTIGNSSLRDRLYRRRRAPLARTTVTGVTGTEVEVEYAVVPELMLGPILFKNVSIAFADVPPFAVFGLSEKPAMLLGTDLMETFRKVSLDFRARKVRFQLKRCSGTRSQTGMTLRFIQSVRLIPEKEPSRACRR